MSKKKNVNSLVISLIIVFLIVSLLPLFITLFDKDKENNNSNTSSTEFEILGSYFDFSNGEMFIELNSGNVRTNKKIDGVFVNVKNIGVEHLKYVSTLIETTDGYYYLSEVESVSSILNTAFDSDCTVTIDIYVKYGDRDFKVDTKYISVKSCWTDPV